ncbi:ADR411Wp [Eremothecium gossypii ATCC 10895]|uniref:DNA damage checkpoint control protein RAD17 n=1 Tax=Eremothecium gossypii (strain ATCC 10895 / CBS 109.51 / FGSC 9923 / NRRL Y-1056) TaxID=284811 RepID=RAD17_EREGS|nr:ADR411Wp [Eremothecium gossypii ATCC 10895]Q758W7.1 RecName: Full=DNA damage checkpoint control protein RAD17 [Eremothecium gossypii ATCC 10895]AAS52330.1 ADR411Wp [Eremothecium gossypii ATCC 10895]AEY96627.1 FADR411Wp [Eremothecium gossypii FDAG1]
MLESTALFSATTIHLDRLMCAFNCMTPFGQRDDVLITIDRDGLTFIRQNNHAAEIQLFLAKELFQYYSIREGFEGEIQLCMKLNHLLDTVSVANRDKDDVVECTLSYDGEGTPFMLILEDSMITEQVEYATYLVGEMDRTGLELDRARLEFECILKGDVLYSALRDLREIGCKECYLYIVTSSRARPMFALVSRGQLGLSKIILPSERSVLEKLEVYENDSTTLIHDAPVIGLFDFAALDKLRPSTKIASKVLIRKDVHGLLAVNILSDTNAILVPEKRELIRASRSVSAEYPTVVIEVFLLEKASVGDIDVRDVHQLMLTSPAHRRSGFADSGSRIVSVTPTATSAAHTGAGSLLGLAPPSAFPAEETQDPDESYHPAPSNTDIPLFL